MSREQLAELDRQRQNALAEFMDRSHHMTRKQYEAERRRIEFDFAHRRLRLLRSGDQ